MHDEPVGREPWGTPIFDPGFLRGIVLRYFLSDLIATHPGRVWSPTELGGALEAQGFHVSGRGRYGAGTVPGSTRRRMRSVVRHRQAVLARELARETRHRFT